MKRTLIDTQTQVTERLLTIITRHSISLECYGVTSSIHFKYGGIIIVPGNQCSRISWITLTHEFTFTRKYN